MLFRSPTLARHHDIEHDEIEGKAREIRARLARIGGGGHPKTAVGQVPAQQFSQAGIVIDDKKMRLGEIGLGCARHAKEYTTDLVSVLLWRQGSEAPPVILSGDDPQHNLPETLHRPRSGFAVGVGDPRALRLRQPSLESASLGRQFEETLPPIMRTGLLPDEVLPNQLAENAAQTLLGDAQDCEELADGDPRVSSDKMDDAMMGAAKTVSRQDRVGLGGEIPIGKKQQLDPLPHLLLVNGRRMSREIYVRHIDLSCNL